MYFNAIPNAVQWTPAPAPKTAGVSAKGLGAVRVGVPRLFVVPRRRGMGDVPILQPSTGTVQAGMINWSGPVTVPSPESYVGQMIQGLEGMVRLKLESGGTILDPSACQAKMSGELASWCSMYPGACTGNEGSMISNLCGQYSAYLADQQASLGNPATNYVAPSITYPIYTEGQDVSYYTPQPTSQPAQVPITTKTPAGQVVTVGAPSPAAPQQVQPTAQPNAQQGGGGSSSGGASSGGGASSTLPAPAPAPAAASSALSDFMSQTFDVFGVSVPAWGALAAVGVGLFMFSGKGR
jgi:hypothetical protein